MGIRFNCPNGHKLNVKEFLAGKRGVCPQCGAKFIIPTSTNVPAVAVPQPVGVGQSQSVEIVISPPPNHQLPMAAPSPSVIIPIADVEALPPELEVPPAVRGPETPSEAVLPVRIVAAPSRIIAAPTEAVSEAALPYQRERSRRNQIIISMFLLVLVILLAGVLVWVLKRDVTQPPAEKTTARDLGELNPIFANTSS